MRIILEALQYKNNFSQSWFDLITCSESILECFDEWQKQKKIGGAELGNTSRKLLAWLRKVCGYSGS